MSIVQISLDELFISNEKLKIFNTKLKDRSELFQIWSTLDWNKLLNKLSIECNNELKSCNIESLKKITNELIQSLDSYFKNNYYWLTIIDSIKAIKFEGLKTTKEVQDKILKWKTHFLLSLKEEEKNLFSFEELIKSKEHFNHQNVKEQLNSFLTFLQSCKVKNDKTFEEQIINNLIDCSIQNISCKQYLVLFINKNRIISSCICTDLFFKNTYHLSYFCGDYITLINNFTQENTNKKYKITFTLFFNESSFQDMLNPIIKCNHLFYMNKIELIESGIKIHYSQSSKTLTNGLQLKELYTDLQKIIKIEKCNSIDIATLKIDISLFTNLIKIEDYIKPLITLLKKEIYIPKYVASKIILKCYYSSSKIKKTITFSELIYELLLTSNIYFKYYLQYLTKDKIVKIIPNFEIDNNDIIHSILLEELNPYPSEESKICFNMDYFDILNIPRYNKTLIDYTIVSKMYTSNVVYIKNCFDEHSINLFPLKTLSMEDIQIENIDTIEYEGDEKNRCNVVIKFSSQLLNLLPNNYDTQYFHIKRMGEKEIKTFIHQEYNFFDEKNTKSEILYMKSKTLIPSVENIIHFIQNCLLNDVKIVCLVSEQLFIFLQLTEQFRNEVMSKMSESTIMVNSLKEIISSKLSLLHSSSTSTKKLTELELESLSIEFCKSLNEIKYLNIQIMNAICYTRMEIIDTDVISITYNQKSETCFSEQTSINGDIMETVENEVVNNFYSINYFDEIGPFYQIDQRDLHRKNEYVDVYDEDDREDEVEQYRNTDYEHALLMAEFNQYNYDPEEFNVELKINLNTKEYFDTLKSEEDYLDFTEKIEELDNEFVELDKKGEENDNISLDLRSNKEEIHMFKPKINIDIAGKNENLDVEDYMIQKNLIKSDVNKSQFSSDVRKSKYDFIFDLKNDSVTSQESPQELKQFAISDMENPLEEEDKGHY